MEVSGEGERGRNGRGFRVLASLILIVCLLGWVGNRRNGILGSADFGGELLMLDSGA